MTAHAPPTSTSPSPLTSTSIRLGPTELDPLAHAHRPRRQQPLADEQRRERAGGRAGGRILADADARGEDASDDLVAVQRPDADRLHLGAREQVQVGVELRQRAARRRRHERHAHAVVADVDRLPGPGACSPSGRRIEAGSAACSKRGRGCVMTARRRFVS